MDKPLITHSKDSNLQTNSLLLLKWLFLCIACISSLFSSLYTLKKQHKNETNVGVFPELDWQMITKTYFSVATISKTMRLGSEYRGENDPIVNYAESCRGSRKCRDVCLEILQHEAGSTRIMMPKDVTCIHKEDTECWRVADMRCWNPEGGKQVWDGIREWDLIYHYRMGNKKMGSFSYYTSNFPWIHLRWNEGKMDFFIFAWGVTRPISNICAEILSSVSSDDHNIPLHLRMVPPDHAVIFGGHSEGAGWAICSNMYLKERLRAPNPSRVIGTGTLVADSQKFLDDYLHLTKSEDNLFLLTLALTVTKEGTRLIPDLFPIFMATEGVTFPQFSYACTLASLREPGQYSQSGLYNNVGMRCLDPQPETIAKQNLFKSIRNRFHLHRRSLEIQSHAPTIRFICNRRFK